MAVSRPPARAAGRDPSLGLEERLRQRAIARDQEGVQAEDLHFLGGLGAGARLADVVELAPLRRARVVERVALRVEVRLAHERRHEGQEQEGDEPGRVDEKPHPEAADGHQVLGLAEELAHQGGAAHGLPARPIQPVLQLAVLEVLEVQRGGVLHEAHAGGVRELLREKGIDEGDDPPQDVGEHRQAELEGEQASPGGRAGRWPATPPGCRARLPPAPGARPRR